LLLFLRLFWKHTITGVEKCGPGRFFGRLKPREGKSLWTGRKKKRKEGTRQVGRPEKGTPMSQKKKCESNWFHFWGGGDL